MVKNSNPKRGKTLNTQDAKRLILVLAVSSTLGFWVLFSNKARQDAASAALNNNSAATGVPPAESQNQIVLDLPPMPTLIPPLDTSANPIVVQPPPQSSTVILPQPQPTLATGKVLLGGSAPQKKPAARVVTVTRSSRP